MSSTQTIQFVGDNVFINIEMFMENVESRMELYQNISELILQFIARDFYIKIIGITIPLESTHAERLFEFLHIFEPIATQLLQNIVNKTDTSVTQYINTAERYTKFHEKIKVFTTSLINCFKDPVTISTDMSTDMNQSYSLEDRRSFKRQCC